MRLQIGRRVFAPSLVPTLLTLILLPTFINLGFWQLHRAQEKRVLMAQAVQGRSKTITLDGNNADSLSRYQHVAVQGTFDNDHQALLDNMHSAQGQPGYRVWTPLKLQDGSIVLIDRGWIAEGKHDVPGQLLPQLRVDAQPRTVTGIMDELPRPGVRAGNAGIGTAWPQLLNYPRINELRTLYGHSLQSRIVLMDANNADGFERIWPINIGFTPQRHIAYAVQWFAFAVTLIVIFIGTNLKSQENRSEHE